MTHTTSTLAPAAPVRPPLPVRPAGAWTLALRRLLRTPIALAGILIIAIAAATAIGAASLTPHDPTRMYAGLQRRPPAWVQGPSPATSGDPRFLLGTDVEGRDVLSRAIYGMRPALVIGIAGAVSAAILGSLLGLIAGYAERRAGPAVMTVAQVMSSLPMLMSFILFYRVLKASDAAPALGEIGLVVLPFALVQWVGAARLVHARVLGVKQELYIEAARSIGAGHGRILFRHILPACFNLIATWTAVTVPQLIVLEAVLGYLGVGVYPYGDESAAALFAITWGKMMESGRKMLFTGPLQVLTPAAAVTIIALAFTFLGDGLREAFDPRSRQ